MNAIRQLKNNQIQFIRNNMMISPSNFTRTIFMNSYIIDNRVISFNENILNIRNREEFEDNLLSITFGSKLVDNTVLNFLSDSKLKFETLRSEVENLLNDNNIQPIMR